MATSSEARDRNHVIDLELIIGSALYPPLGPFPIRIPLPKCNDRSAGQHRAVTISFKTGTTTRP